MMNNNDLYGFSNQMGNLRGFADEQYSNFSWKNLFAPHTLATSKSGKNIFTPHTYFKKRSILAPHTYLTNKKGQNPLTPHTYLVPDKRYIETKGGGKGISKAMAVGQELEEDFDELSSQEQQALRDEVMYELQLERSQMAPPPVAKEKEGMSMGMKLALGMGGLLILGMMGYMMFKLGKKGTK